MIKKLILFLALSFAFCDVENVELIADKILQKDKIIIADGKVFVYSKSYFITANSAKFDQKNGIVELFGDVNLMYNLNESARSDYLKIELKNNKRDFGDSFFADKNTEIWLNSKESCDDENFYYSKNSIVSSCDVENPDWRVEFSSGKFNKTSKFLHLYNPVFYIGKIPVFYLPYFAFPTDKTRRSGLLFPGFGYGKDEGFFYQQPIYIAPNNILDWTFIPQIRTIRGKGIFSEFRIMDSEYSKLNLNFGIFEENQKYAKENSLKNSVHKGFDIKYERDKILKYKIDADFSEGLWINYTNLNDISYINLQKNLENKNYKEDSLIASKFNYFLKTDENYLGIYAKYFFDTTKNTNKQTLQEIPSLHYHKFIDEIFLKNLTYSFDTKFSNFTRSSGATARQYEANLPLNLNFNFDYFKINLSENFYATNMNYSDKLKYTNGKIYEQQDDFYANNYHKFSIQSDLAKAYDEFFHTTFLSVNYLLPGFNKGNFDNKILKTDAIKQNLRNLNLHKLNDENSDYYENNFLKNLDEIYTTQNINAKIVNYFYDKSGKKFIYQKTDYGYNFDDERSLPLSNDFYIYFDNLAFYNKIKYDLDKNIFNLIQTGAKYKTQDYYFDLSHTYENNSKNDFYKTESYVKTAAGINLPDFYRIFGKFAYDLENNFSKDWSIGVGKQKKCWDFSFVYKVDNDPILTEQGIKSKRTRGIYLMFSLYPMGKLNYDFDVTRGKDDA